MIFLEKGFNHTYTCKDFSILETSNIAFYKANYVGNMAFTIIAIEKNKYAKSL